MVVACAFSEHVYKEPQIGAPRARQPRRVFNGVCSIIAFGITEVIDIKADVCWIMEVSEVEVGLKFPTKRLPVDLVISIHQTKLFNNGAHEHFEICSSQLRLFRDRDRVERLKPIR